MKKIIVFFLLLPLFTWAQDIPEYGFDKVRIAGSQDVVQADVMTTNKKITAKMDRSYFWYNANTIQCTQGGYSGYLLNGNYSAYYLNKGLKQQGIFKNGLKNGIWRTWNENGTLSSVYTWKDGIRSGLFYVYDNQGKISQSGQYKNDKIFSDTTSFLQRLNFFSRKHSASK